VDLPGIGESELALMMMWLWAGIVESEFADFTRLQDEKLARSCLRNPFDRVPLFQSKVEITP
jgi:hypothetical protein